MKIKLHIIDAQKKFSKQDCEAIRNGVIRAEEYAVPRLNIAENVEIVVTPNLKDFLIPEDHLGAFTYNGNFVLISFAEGHVIEDLVYEVVCHEMCHAARWQKNNEDMKNLFDGMILEGLAVAFEKQAVASQNTKQYFLKEMLGRTDEENRKVLKTITNDLDKNDYSYFTFGDKERNIPRWAGYSVGYYMVKKYLEQNSTTVEEVFAKPYEVFRTVLN